MLQPGLIPKTPRSSGLLLSGGVVMEVVLPLRLKRVEDLAPREQNVRLEFAAPCVLLRFFLYIVRHWSCRVLDWL